MAYKGFAGNGYVGNFLSTTTLETQYPAQMHAGRRATVEATVGQVSPYFSDGGVWSATVQSTVNPTTGGMSFLVGDTPIPLADPLKKQMRSNPGTTVLDFSTGSSSVTSSANQSSCTAVWNPTGWSDGTGCLEITPDVEDDAFAEFRMYLDSTKQFDLWSDDGFAVEWMCPNMESLSGTNPKVSIEFGSGATSTASPANRTEFRLINYPSGTVYFSGKRYDRCRWDITTSDAKSGPWPGTAPIVTGAGVTKMSTINWTRIILTKFGGKTFKFRRIVRGGRARPVIVMATDAAPFYPLSELVSAYFAQAGWKWSINQYFGGGDGVDDLAKSRAVINAVYSAGGDFNVNDLIDRNLSTAGLTSAQSRTMAESCISKAIAYGWRRGSNVFVYNNNGFNDSVVDGLLAAGIVAGRAGINEGRFVYTEGGVVNPMRLPSATWDQLTGVQITAQVDRIIESGATQWTYWHNVFSTARVTDDGQTAVGVSTPSAYAALNSAYCTPRGINALTVWWEELKTGLDYIKAKEAAGLIDVMSPSEWLFANGVEATLI